MTVEQNGKLYNTSFRIFKVDEISGKYRLFMTAPAEVFGYPMGFLQKIQPACGLWPGEPEKKGSKRLVWYQKKFGLNK
jgi:hypothetical protein